MIKVKKDMIAESTDFRKFRVVENLEEKVMWELLSWLRFVEFDENISLMYQYQGAAIQAAQKYRRDDSDSDEEPDPTKGFKAKDLPPISIKNEKKVLQKVFLLAKS